MANFNHTGTSSRLSRQWKFGETRPIVLLREFNIRPQWMTTKHWPFPREKRQLVVGDQVFLKYMGQLRIIPFAKAGDGFEIMYNPREGIDYTYDLDWKP